ncbi:LysR family transcriptional regulator ArgP [Vreelandella populi]|uniref:LysR family transcriptional regulator ArgP n=1 Tax=Vreelandella populi TaxID=2498858 RepID=A0A3S0YNK5_9GAMM|nr:LysR family transcriptional regulator ArgP [Halomonas populi]RUR35400.1 LysR family transcriptional regulator ArgP [Halomonas populi]RUR47590.1 LysR family transcriptional regulator ArgP [Halomonas populi]
MLDYKLLAALAAVIEQGGFERAANTLGLSQSAVSQRVKLLEARIGQPVLVRATPPAPTEIGRRLLNHVQQVRLLERDLTRQVPALDDAVPERLRLAINADSLATWWPSAVSGFCTHQNVLLELVVEDQEVGLKRMRAGEVAGCVCAAERPVAGANSVALGAMSYLAVASPAFMTRYFAGGISTDVLPQAPAIVFGADDQLQHRYLATLNITGSFAYHLCPSSEGFVRLLESGLGWGMVPELQVRDELAQGKLVELITGHVIHVPLYWHYWRNGGRLLAGLTQHLRHEAQAALVPL